MLFSSHEFLFGFLPVAVIAFHFARKYLPNKAAIGVLALFSFFFYGWWNPPYLALLGGSIIGNFLLARWLSARQNSTVLYLGVTLNLAVLGYFKYRNFFLDNIGYLTGTGWELEALFVPLAISFFTFQQIAFLVDVKDGRAHVDNPTGYVAFVALFPQLIAGPIVLYREIEEQFADIGIAGANLLSKFARGLFVFAIGLFKKIAFADSIAPYADTAFAKADSLTFLEAWAGAGAYSLQLYFDFSGYSDMAVGLGLMLGLTLPFNFDVPFRSTSMIVFWKRWHITMTRFFMMYLYSPISLAVMRWGAARDLSGLPAFAATIAMPIFVTFLLSGLWHGAAWTFVAFGGVNAIGLTVNHAWREAKFPRPPAFIAWLLTMLTVVISFVYFRAASLADAHAVLTAMFSPHHLILPNWLSGLAAAFGVPWRTLELFASGAYTVRLAVWIILLSCVALIRRNPAAHPDDIKPTWTSALLTAGALLISIALLDRPQAFIYFQF